MLDNVTHLRRPVHGSSFHYKDYLNDRCGWDGAFENPHGFIAYKQVNETEMRVCDAYTEPKLRGMGLMKELLQKVEELAVSKGCHMVTLVTQTDRESMLAALHLGFTPVQAHNNEILYMKRIGVA
jgi:GNAT superfamily N-acetyltransferase